MWSGALALLVLQLSPGAAGPPAAPDRCATIVAGGDILLDRGVAAEARANHDPGWPLATLPAIFAGADLAMANLEGTLTTRAVPQRKRHTFRAPPSAGRLLRRAGLDLVNLANNHGYDYGRAALMDTLANLRRSGLRVVGAGRDLTAASAPVVLQVHGLRVAVLGLVTLPLEGLPYRPDLPTPAVAEEELVARALRQAHSKADLVVVQVHWGTEWKPLPDADQRRWASLFRENGADLVLGHHPHVVQPVEEVGGRWVFFSLGDFVFDHLRQPGRRSLAARITFCREGGVRSVAVLPLELQRTRPVPASGYARRAVLEALGAPVPRARPRARVDPWVELPPGAPPPGAAQK